jgi:hypothetical protein
MPQLSNAQHEQIEKLAYRLRKERGEPLGSPDDDWFRASGNLYSARIRRRDSHSRR